MERRSGVTCQNVDGAPHAVVLPPPFTDEDEDKNIPHSRGVLFFGPSAVFLNPMRLFGSTADGQGSENDDGDDSTVRTEAAQEFNLSYVPFLKGFSRIGGLRVILVEDRLIDEDQTVSDDAVERPFGMGQNNVGGLSDMRILKEWDVIGEVWVKT